MKSPEGSRSAGYAFMFMSTTFFTLMAASSKIIGSRASSEQKLFWRSGLSIFFTLGQMFYVRLFQPRTEKDEVVEYGARRSPWPRQPVLLMCRGLLGHMALVAYLESINRLPLAEAVFLGKIHPLAAAVFARIFLAEPLPLVRIVAIFVSLGGVALIAQPSADAVASGDVEGVVLALLAGVLTGGAYLCVRALARSGESEHWMLLSLPSVSLCCTFHHVLSSASGNDDRPELRVWFLVLALSAQGGQIFLNRGLRALPVATGTQCMYFGAISGIMMGVPLGEPWPKIQFWIGGLLILAALHLGEAFGNKVSSS